MEPRRLIVEDAIAEMLPEANPTKAALSDAISHAACLLEDDESILRLYQWPTLPRRERGAGLVLVTDRALMSVDSRPPDAARCHRIPGSELRAITVIPVGGRHLTGVAALGEHDTVEFFIGYRYNAESFVEELRGCAPDAVGADPAAVVAHWWDDPRIAWPRPLSLGARWEYVSGLAEFPGGQSGLRMDLSSTGIAATRLGAGGVFRIALPWERVQALRVEGARQMERRPTLTRMLPVGLIGAKRRKNLTLGLVVAELNDGDEVIFASPRHTESELRSALSSILAAAGSSTLALQPPGARRLTPRGDAFRLIGSPTTRGS